MCRLIIFGFLFFVTIATYGQQDSYVTIRKIEIEGNKKTKPYIIHRELEFEIGDSIFISDLPKVLERTENNLLNTILYNQVTVNVSEWDTDKDMIDILVTLQESWYIYLVPIAELADRNFNVWWNEFNGSLSRLNLGVRFQHLNLSGNNDRLKFLAQFGFTPKFEVEYGFPNINRSKTLGATISYLHSTNKESGYANFENKLLFAENNEMVMLRRNRARLNVVHRPNIYAYHEIKAEFQNNQINPLISDTLNRHFFLDGRKSQSFISLLYKFRYDERDVRIYPLEGMSIEIELEKTGIGIWNDIDLLTFSPAFTRYIRPSPVLSLGTTLRGKISILRDQPPYYQNRGLGYGNNFVRGYELYVVDGQDFFVMKNSAKFKLFEKNFDLGKAMFIQQFRVMPIKLFFTLNFDVGYVNEMYYSQSNDFTNRWLYGGGPALDLILYNNFLFQFEVSANHLGEVGVFLHNSVSF